MLWYVYRRILRVGVDMSGGGGGQEVGDSGAVMTRECNSSVKR